MYILIGLLLTVCAIIELGNKTAYRKNLYTMLAIVLTALLAFRYGQGSDYYGYYLQFNRVDASASLLVNSLYHGELGWYIILVVSKRLGISFELFIGIVSLIMMSSINRAIKKYSPYGITSLLLLYPTFYLTYFFSAIRQGLVMSIFLGFGLELLLEKRNAKYYLLIIALCFIHKSAIVLLILPLCLHFEYIKWDKFCIIAVATGVFFSYSGILNRFATSLEIGAYFRVSISIMAILLRTALFYIIYNIHTENKTLRTHDDYEAKIEDVFYFIYMIGFAIYLTFAFSGTLSQRLTMPLKSIEILLLPLLFHNLHSRIKETGTRFKFLKIGSIKIVALAIVIMLMINVETVKNINSYIQQGNYYSWVNPINYPYSSIFDKDNIRNFISHFDEEVE